MTAKGSQSVVVGAGIAGLVAASVLAGQGHRVTLVERDELPDDTGVRRGVPQARHAHVLLAAGLAVLEKLLPGLERELAGAGALRLDMARDMGVLGPMGWTAPFDRSLTLYSMSRGLVEGVIRRRVRAEPAVTVLDGERVEGLRIDDGAVRGVQLADRVLDADLVVDASGRGSRSSDWLVAAGYPAPEETYVDAHISYASRVFRAGGPLPNDWRMLFLMGTPDRPRAALLVPLEGERFLLSLSGAAEHKPPTDEEGYLAFARSLRTPLAADFVAAAEPDSPIYASHSTRSSWRHFERLRRRPAGFVPIGDSLCSFNPVYGQGMTVAAMQVAVLRAALADGGTPATLAAELPRRFAEVVRMPWTTATIQDTRPPTTDGARIRGARAMDWYTDTLWELATRDPGIASTLWSSYQMVTPSRELFRPRIAGRVVAQRIGRRRPAPVLETPRR